MSLPTLFSEIYCIMSSTDIIKKESGTMADGTLPPQVDGPLLVGISWIFSLCKFNSDTVFWRRLYFCELFFGLVSQINRTEFQGCIDVGMNLNCEFSIYV